MENRHKIGLQTFNIPCELGFQPRSCAWALRKARVVEGIEERSVRLAADKAKAEGPGMSALFADPTFANATQLTRIPSKDVIVRTDDVFGRPIEFSIDPKELPPGANSRRKTFNLFVGLPGMGGQDGEPVDAREMRQEFITAMRTRKLLRFLEKWGTWGSTEKATESLRISSRRHVLELGTWRWAQYAPLLAHTGSSLESVYGSGSDPDMSQSVFIFPAELEALQQHFRAGMLSDPAEWIGSSELFRRGWPQARSTFPFFAMTLSDCRSIIEASITLDKLQRVEVAVCSLDTCRAPFAVTTRHHRNFCTRACKNLSAIRSFRHDDTMETGNELAPSPVAPADPA